MVIYIIIIMITMIVIITMIITRNLIRHEDELGGLLLNLVNADLVKNSHSYNIPKFGRK